MAKPIIIDPGHGPHHTKAGMRGEDYDPGTGCTKEGTQYDEAKIVRAVVKSLIGKLAEADADIKAITTDECIGYVASGLIDNVVDDKTKSIALRQRVIDAAEYARDTCKTPPVFFLSVHVNANSNLPDAHGADIFYWNPQEATADWAFAENFMKNYLDYTLSFGGERYKTFIQGKRNLPDEVNYAVLRHALRQGIENSLLIELGFITNENDSAILCNEDDQKIIGEALALAVADALTQK